MMIFPALMEAVERGELILVEKGFCRWHKRKDGVVVIREILVLPDARRLGIGRRMIRDIIRQWPGAKLLARCPVADEKGKVGCGNVFWKHLGFTLTATANGLNTWELQNSSTAPTGTLCSLASR
jgi:GNAT superfamily N-acetyltransferase